MKKVGDVQVIPPMFSNFLVFSGDICNFQIFFQFLDKHIQVEIDWVGAGGGA